VIRGISNWFCDQWVLVLFNTGDAAFRPVTN